MQTYTEIELNRWMEQLKGLRETAGETFGNAADRRWTIEDYPLTFRSSSYKVSNEWKVKTVEYRHQMDDVYCLVRSPIPAQTRWLTNGRTVAGGHGRGSALNQLHQAVLASTSITMAQLSSLTLTIIESCDGSKNTRQGDVIVGGKGPGNRPDQLNKTRRRADRSNTTIAWLSVNEKIDEWSAGSSLKTNRRASGEKTILSNIYSLGLAMDDEGSLYVSDYEKHEVRRYSRRDDRDEVIVAGGRGQGAALNQLDGPRHIFVDANHSVLYFGFR